MEQKELKERYNEYVERMNKRNEAITDDSKKLKVKSLKDWQRVGKDKDGKPIPVPGESGETAAESSTRIAKERMNKALTALSRVENLGNDNYQFTPEQVEKMQTVLKAKIDGIVTILETKKNAPAPAEETAEEKKQVFEF